MKRVGSKLVPASPMDEEILGIYCKPDEQVKVRITKPRSLPYNRWWWALLQIVSENLDDPYDTPEKLHLYLKIATGALDAVHIHDDGTPVYVVRSTSFAKMDRAEFRKHVELALDVIQKIWNGEVSASELVAQANQRSAVNYKELVRAEVSAH